MENCRSKPVFSSRYILSPWMRTKARPASKSSSSVCSSISTLLANRLCHRILSSLRYPLLRIYCWPLVFSMYDLCYSIAGLFFLPLDFSVIAASERHYLQVIFLYQPHLFFIVLISSLRVLCCFCHHFLYFPNKMTSSVSVLDDEKTR